MEEKIAQIKALLQRARRLFVVTGAGVSADSGLPTYRGFGGLYEEKETPEGLPIEEVLSGAMMARRPELPWKYLMEIEAACRGKRPNEGHLALAKAQERFELVILTQNIDGFHEEAGSKEVIDIHGNLHRLACPVCNHRSQVADYCGLDCPPLCRCGAVLRPEVVLFGEMLPEPKVRDLYQCLREDWDLVLSIGTTSVFPYIAAPVIEAKQQGVPTVEINPGVSQVSDLVDFRLQMGAAAALTRLFG